MSQPCYQHLLVALDLDGDNTPLLRRAVALAHSQQAKLSVIHVDVDMAEVYSELVDIDLQTVQDHHLDETRGRLDAILANYDYPLERRLLVNGDLGERVQDAVNQYGVDLLICGHHQSFWSLLVSSARQLMNQVPCEMLVIPLKG
ncbi:MAG: universal stress protein [Aeromonadaceae bacterium]